MSVWASVLVSWLAAGCEAAMAKNNKTNCFHQNYFEFPIFHAIKSGSIKLEGNDLSMIEMNCVPSGKIDSKWQFGNIVGCCKNKYLMNDNGRKWNFVDVITLKVKKREQATNDCLTSPQIQNSFSSGARSGNGRKGVKKGRRRERERVKGKEGRSKPWVK